jgi:hypothetical protein
VPAARTDRRRAVSTSGRHLASGVYLKEDSEAAVGQFRHDSAEADSADVDVIAGEVTVRDVSRRKELAAEQVAHFFPLAREELPLPAGEGTVTLRPAEHFDCDNAPFLFGGTSIAPVGGMDQQARPV